MLFIQNAVLGIREWIFRSIRETNSGRATFGANGRISNQEYYMDIIYTILANRIFLEFYHVKGHVDLRNKASLAHAKYLFLKSNPFVGDDATDDLIYYIAMGNNDAKSEGLYSAMRKIFNEEEVPYNDNVYATKNGVIRGTSDHQIFRMYGYPSLVLGDDNIIDIVHTDNDNLDNVDYSDLEKLSEVIYKFISENRYDMNEIKTGN